MAKERTSGDVTMSPDAQPRSPPAPVGRDAVLEAIDAIAQAAHIPTDAFQVTGPAVAKWFHLRLSPLETLPVEDTARALLAERRGPDGAWKDLTISSPTGAQVRLYLDRDRCLADRRINWHITATLKLIKARHPSADVVPTRASGTISCQWRDIVAFTFLPESNGVLVKWHDEVFGPARHGRRRPSRRPPGRHPRLGVDRTPAAGVAPPTPLSVRAHAGLADRSADAPRTAANAGLRRRPTPLARRARRRLPGSRAPASRSRHGIVAPSSQSLRSSAASGPSS